MKKKIAIAVILVLAIAAVIVYQKIKEETPDVANAKPDIATDVNTLVAAFNSDTASASKKYLNKIVEVTGNVKSVDSSAVVLGDQDSPSGVTVGLDRRHLKDHEGLKVGRVAVLQGICSGYSKAEGDDLLSALGTTIELRSGSVKNKNQ